MFVFLIILSFIVAILDASLFPTLKIAGGIIELTTISMLILVFFGSFRSACIFLIFSAIFLSLLTKIPAIYFLIPNFVILAVFVFLTTRRIVTKPGTLLSFPIFFFAVLVVDLIKLTILAKFSFFNLSITVVDSLYSAVFATIIYWSINKIYHFFNPQISGEKIKFAK